MFQLCLSVRGGVYDHFHGTLNHMGTSLPSPTTWTWSNLFTWYPRCVDHTSNGKRAISLQLKGFLVSFKFSESPYQENLVVGERWGVS